MSSYRFPNGVQLSSPAHHRSVGERRFARLCFDHMANTRSGYFQHNQNPLIHFSNLTHEGSRKNRKAGSCPSSAETVEIFRSQIGATYLFTNQVYPDRNGDSSGTEERNLTQSWGSSNPRSAGSFLI